MRAFTLVEMLVAIAVFILMMSLLLQMMDSTMQATHLTYHEIDSTRGARTILDALSADLGNMVTVNGLTVMVSQDSANNTRLVFLTQGRGPNGQSNVRFMAVAYRLSSEGALTRSASPVLWTDVDLIASALASLSSTTTSTIANGCLRFEAMASLDNGSIVPLSTTGNWKIGIVNGTTLPANYYGLLLSAPPVDPNNPRVRSLIVAAAVIDPQSYKLPNVSAMGGSLSSPTASVDLVDTWNADRASSRFASYPKPAVAALSFAEQIYSLK